MRFDLLDEHSALVPFRRGVSGNRAFQDPTFPAVAAKRGTIANFVSHLALLRKLPGALCRMVLSRYRNVVEK
jgi:hypothetical protein